MTWATYPDSAVEVLQGKATCIVLCILELVIEPSRSKAATQKRQRKRSHLAWNMKPVTAAAHADQLCIAHNGRRTRVCTTAHALTQAQCKQVSSKRWGRNGSASSIPQQFCRRKSGTGRTDLRHGSAARRGAAVGPPVVRRAATRAPRPRATR